MIAFNFIYFVQLNQWSFIDREGDRAILSYEKGFSYVKNKETQDWGGKEVDDTILIRTQITQKYGI